MNHCELTLEVLINSCHRNRLALFQTSAVSDLPSLLFSNANEERIAPPLILILQGYNYIITVNQTLPLCHYNWARCLKLTANGLIFFSSSNMGREELEHTKSSSPLKCTESQDSDQQHLNSARKEITARSERKRSGTAFDTERLQSN